MAGYHLKEISKYEYGTIDKIQEEVHELYDARSQGAKVMELIELSDIIGAVEGYLEKEFPEMALEDLIIMSNITKRAFKSGGRQ